MKIKRLRELNEKNHGDKISNIQNVPDRKLAKVKDVLKSWKLPYTNDQREIIDELYDKLYVRDSDDKLTKIKNFAKKISSKLQVSDYKLLSTKDGEYKVLKGFGLPIDKNDINDDNRQEIQDLLMGPL